MSDLGRDTAALVLNDLQQRVLLYGGMRWDGDPAHADLALTIEQIEAVARGDDTVTDAVDVRDLVQTVCEALFGRPAEAEYAIPDDWWSSPLGRVCATALAVTEGEELISIVDAARELDVSMTTLWARVQRQGYRYVVIQDKQRGRPRRMLYRADVLAER